MKYKYVCCGCKTEYKYNVGRCTNLVESEDTGLMVFCGCKVRMVKDETTN